MRERPGLAALNVVAEPAVGALVVGLRLPVSALALPPALALAWDMASHRVHKRAASGAGTVGNASANSSASSHRPATVKTVAVVPSWSTSPGAQPKALASSVSSGSLGESVRWCQKERIPPFPFGGQLGLVVGLLSRLS